MRRRQLLFALLISAGTLAGVSGPTSAQTTRPATMPTAELSDRHGANDHAGFLAGPRVSEEAMNNNAVSFGGGDRRDRPVTVPVNQWMRMLRELELSPQQSRQVRRIAREYQDANAAFRKAHGEEIRLVRQLLQDARTNATPLDDDQRTRVDSLQSKRPKAELYQQRLWKLLDQKQQGTMIARLDEQRAIISARRARQRTGAREGALDNSADAMSRPSTEPRQRAKN